MAQILDGLKISNEIKQEIKITFLDQLLNFQVTIFYIKPIINTLRKFF